MWLGHPLEPVFDRQSTVQDLFWGLGRSVGVRLIPLLPAGMLVQRMRDFYRSLWSYQLLQSQHKTVYHLQKQALADLRYNDVLHWSPTSSRMCCAHVFGRRGASTAGQGPCRRDREWAPWYPYQCLPGALSLLLWGCRNLVPLWDRAGLLPARL